MYLDNLKTRDFYVMNDYEAAAYLEHLHFSETGRQLDDDEYESLSDVIYDYGIQGGYILPCNDDVFDYWHVIPYAERHAYSVDRIRRGGLFIADSLVAVKDTFSGLWLQRHRYEFKYRLSA
jgi:hypothetical protein